MEPRFAICVGAYDSPKLAPRPGRGVQPTTCRLRSIQRRLDRQVLNAPTARPEYTHLATKRLRSPGETEQWLSALD